MKYASLALTLFGYLLCSSVARADQPARLRRVAVVVGSNKAAPGRQPLRYAEDDARKMADALERVGQFAPVDVTLLLDPPPQAVTGALDQAAAKAQNSGGPTLFLFYYSGHSDGESLFPDGNILSISDIRNRIPTLNAKIRIGILDTCRGGSWTRAKGLTVGPPLTASDLINVATEGTALVSSSSGLESAHEADTVHGSFFTHYFTTGLLGAADRSGDGNVTLQEAFDYAREWTIRDSARLAKAAQHPSFDLQLRGRQDIALTTCRAAIAGGGRSLSGRLYLGVLIQLSRQ